MYLTSGLRTGVGGPVDDGAIFFLDVIKGGGNIDQNTSYFFERPKETKTKQKLLIKFLLYPNL